MTKQQISNECAHPPDFYLYEAASSAKGYVSPQDLDTIHTTAKKRRDKASLTSNDGETQVSKLDISNSCLGSYNVAPHRMNDV